jgi:predicted TIM-barrel fold metal-dependent hydrolase
MWREDLAMRDGFKLFDCHTYIGRLLTGDVFGIPAVLDAGAMIQLMDEAGVDKVVVMASGESGPEYTEANELVARSMGAHPDRIHGFARVNPRYGAKAVQDVEYWIGERRLCGLKLSGLGEGFVVNDRDLIGPIIEKVDELRVPVLMHAGGSWQCTPALIADLAMDFPGVSFIIAHMGLFGGHEEAIAFARRVKNLFLDTALFCSPGAIKRAVVSLGAERVLYGSNAPFLPFEFEIEKIAKYSDLSDEEAQLVLGGNIARLLGVEL